MRRGPAERDEPDNKEPEPEICFICGQPAGGGAMESGAHVLCSWGLTDYQRRLKQIVKRRGFFPSVEALEARETE